MMQVLSIYGVWLEEHMLKWRDIEWQPQDNEWWPQKGAKQ